MSFVGIVLHKNMIIGFGDTKVSIADALGLCEDTDAGPMRKVFKNDSFVIAACNANVFFEPVNKRVTVEEWMKKHISEFSEPFPLMEQLQSDISILQDVNNGRYDFLVGGFDKYGAYEQTFYVESGKVTAYNKIRNMSYGAKVIPAGNRYYNNEQVCGRLAQIISLPDNDDIRSIITKFINGIVAEADRKGPYNPVGGEIIVETLYPPTKGDLPEGVI